MGYSSPEIMAYYITVCYKPLKNEENNVGSEYFAEDLQYLFVFFYWKM